MPSTTKTIDCDFCKKTFRCDVYARHCINNHADEIAELMSADSKKARAQRKMPILTVYRDSKPFFHMCCACKKYNNSDSERGGSMHNFVSTHSRLSKECAEQFDRFKTLFEMPESAVPENVIVEAPPAPEFMNKLFETLQIDKDDYDSEEQTAQDYILENIASYVKVSKTGAEANRKRFEKLELAKAAVEEDYRAFKERYAFRLEQRIARAVRTGDKEEAESFNEEINDYDSEEYPKLHFVYNKFLDLCD